MKHTSIIESGHSLGLRIGRGIERILTGDTYTTNELLVNQVFDALCDALETNGKNGGIRSIDNYTLDLDLLNWTRIENIVNGLRESSKYPILQIAEIGYAYSEGREPFVRVTTDREEVRIFY